MAKPRVVARARPRPQTAPVPPPNPFQQQANQLGQSVGTFLTSKIPSVEKAQQNVGELINATKWPGSIIPEGHAETNPEHIAASLKENLKLAGVK